MTSFVNALCCTVSLELRFLPWALFLEELSKVGVILTEGELWDLDMLFDKGDIWFDTQHNNFTVLTNAFPTF